MINIKFKKIFEISLFLFLFIFSFSSESFAAEIVQLNSRNAVIAAYQRAYAMNFEIWKPEGLPSGWYATFDGFPVAQVSENRWVYGQLGVDGAVIPTDILVGSVIPMNVPGLVRVAATGNSEIYTSQINSEAFRKILNYDCNRMGFLTDPYLRTVIAWSTRRANVYLWLGDRWKKFSPGIGEYTWEYLKRNSVFIHEELLKHNAILPIGENFEAADLARQWGILWLGETKLESLNFINRGNGGDNKGEGRNTSGRSTSDTQDDTQDDDNSKGNWDTGR